MIKIVLSYEDNYIDRVEKIKEEFFDDVDYFYVEDYINKNIITVPYNSDIVDVLKVMSQNKVKRVLVENEKKIKGVISLSDIINSNYEERVLIDTLKNIYAIKQKENNAEIDEFYL